jgi:hypothetical protein
MLQQTCLLSENMILTAWDLTFLYQPIRNQCGFALTNHRCLMRQQTCLLAENVILTKWDIAFLVTTNKKLL